MKQYLAIRQSEDKLITSFEFLDANSVNQFVENFKQEMARWYGSSIEIEEEYAGDATIYKVTSEESLLESLSLIKQKKTDSRQAKSVKKIKHLGVIIT